MKPNDTKGLLIGADLSEADLSRAHLIYSETWKGARTWRRTNIYRVINASVGFPEYVLVHGGIEKATEKPK